MTSREIRILGLAGVLLAGIAMVVLTAIEADRANGGLGFPLDDSWIHLQFARNLHQYGAYSYYRDEQVTSGSTSPLYTGLLALGMTFTGNEFLLSYALGVAFLLLSGLLMFRLGRHFFPGRLSISLGLAALVVLEPRLQWISLSGMETTLFIALLLLTVLCYVEKRPVWLGVCGGLLLWARPEGLLMIAILVIDRFYHTKVVTSSGPAVSAADRSRWFWGSMGIATVIVAAYAAFDLVLSGSFFPNTVAAKLAYYSSGGSDYAAQVIRFTSAGHMIVVAPFAVIGMLSVLLDVIRRRPASMLIPSLWAVAMIAGYGWKLPYLYQRGRYLMPVLPFVFLSAAAGLQIAVARFRASKRRRFARVLVVVVMVSVTLGASWGSRISYARSCRYIDERQVATARWIHEHLSDDAVVATHDVGAIAYYSGRRIVDMVGLISPAAIDRLGHIDLLLEYLRSEHVTHLAVLRTWFDVSNVSPLFMTDEMHPEVMEVFVFDPDRMHFTDHTAALLSEQARLELAAGDVQRAGAMLQQALTYDTQSARIHFLLGQALLMAGRTDDAQREIEAARLLQPDLPGLREAAPGGAHAP